jgi:hypothetical protein
MEYKESNMKKFWKKNKVDCIIMGIALALASMLAYCGSTSTPDLFAAGSKENCPKWEIDPPVPCAEAPHIFDAQEKNVYFLDSREAFQVCEDGRGVGWHWGGELPHNDRNAWFMMFSYSVENTKIRVACMVKGDSAACDEFIEVINEIVDCWKREGVE